MTDDLLYFRHIMECTRRIEHDTSGGRDEFLASHTLQDAAVWEIVKRDVPALKEAVRRMTETPR